MRVRILLTLALAFLVAAGIAGAGKIVVLGEKTDTADQSEDREDKAGDQRFVSEGTPTEDQIDSLREAAEHLKIEIGDHPARKRTNQVISFGHDVKVEADEIVQGDVVAMLGSVEVNGVVRGDVVALGGQVRLGDQAQVHGDAISIMGAGVRLSPNSVITGQAVAIGGRVDASPGARFGDRVEMKFIPSFGGQGMGARGWVLLLVLCLHFVFIGLVGLVLYKLAPHRWNIGAATLKERSGESLLAGIGAGIVWAIVGLPLMLVVMIALVALVVGIPLVPLVAFLMFIVPLPGYLITSLLVGEALLNRENTQTTERVGGWSAPYLLGHLLLTVPWLIMIPISVAPGLTRLYVLLLLLGWGVITLAVAFGWGAFLLSRFGSRPPRTALAVPPAGQGQEMAPAS